MQGLSQNGLHNSFTYNAPLRSGLRKSPSTPRSTFTPSKLTRSLTCFSCLCNAHSVAGAPFLLSLSQSKSSSSPASFLVKGPPSRPSLRKEVGPGFLWRISSAFLTVTRLYLAYDWSSLEEDQESWAWGLSALFFPVERWRPRLLVGPDWLHLQP